METPKVLIAEDESIIALDIRRTLETRQFNVIGTARTYNGVEKRVKEESPDFLITSMSLKKSTEYLDKIVNLQKQYNFKVVFLSAQLNAGKIKKFDSSSFGFIKNLLILKL